MPPRIGVSPHHGLPRRDTDHGPFRPAAFGPHASSRSRRASRDSFQVAERRIWTEDAPVPQAGKAGERAIATAAAQCDDSP